MVSGDCVYVSVFNCGYSKRIPSWEAKTKVCCVHQRHMILSMLNIPSNWKVSVQPTSKLLSLFLNCVCELMLDITDKLFTDCVAAQSFNIVWHFFLKLIFFQIKDFAVCFILCNLQGAWQVDRLETTPVFRSTETSQVAQNRLVDQGGVVSWLLNILAASQVGVFTIHTEIGITNS